MGRLLTQCYRKPVAICRKLCRRDVAAKVYDNGKRPAANQQKNAIVAEEITGKCVAVGLGVGNVSDTSYTASEMH
jgi:hypothetical protein